MKSSSGVRRWARLQDAIVVTATYVATAMFVWNGRIAVTRVAQRPPHWFAFVLVAVGVAPLLVRRTRPVVAFLGTIVGVSALALFDAPIGLPLAAGVALYSVATRRAPSTRLSRVGLVVAGGLVAYIASCAISITAPPWSELGHTVLLWSACWFAGERTRLQREQLEELRRDAMRERALATAEERMRIARDLHDAAGHAINVIAVHAGAARLRHGEDPDRTLAALTTIEELARETVAEIDSMVGSLRSVRDRPDAAPASLDSLPSLVRQHVDAGHSVEVRTRGGRRRLPAAVDQAAYRIIQEGLTNASRHGVGPAAVELDFGDDALAVTITNPVSADAPTARCGHGLIGAGERAGLVGGRLDTTIDRGVFVLAATLPTTGGPR